MSKNNRSRPLESVRTSARVHLPPSGYSSARGELERIGSPLAEGCLKDGVYYWKEPPFNPKLQDRARALRKAGNLAEALLWLQIKKKQLLGLDFDRQFVIGNYIVDFYCKEVGLVVEIDGCSHEGKEEYDDARNSYLEGLGLLVLHISDHDVRKNMDEVLEYLKQTIENTPPPCGVLLCERRTVTRRHT